MSAAQGDESTTSVLAALAANVTIALAKGIAAALTGSPALLAETLHTVADAGNEVLLWVALHRSQPPAARQPGDRGAVHDAAARAVGRGGRRRRGGEPRGRLPGAGRGHGRRRRAHGPGCDRRRRHRRARSDPARCRARAARDRAALPDAGPGGRPALATNP